MTHKQLIVLAFVLQLVALTPCLADTKRPVIGVFSQPSAFPQLGYPPEEYSYIAASYVKFLEMAGAEVIPIQWDAPTDVLDEIFSQINGFLLPGGNSTIASQGIPSNFTLAAKYMIDKAIEAHSHGDIVTVWGTCQGFQMLSSITADNYSLLIHVDGGYNISKPIIITAPGLESKMFENLGMDLEKKVETQPLLYFHHNWTPDPASWNENPYLLGNFTITSLAKDAHGSLYVTTIEGIDLPFYGSQFHPEKNAHEWPANYDINHDHDAILVEQHFANFFVNQTRKSTHLMDEEVLKKMSIKNFNPIHNPTVTYMQMYLFKNYKNEPQELEEATPTPIPKTSRVFYE